MGDGTVPTSTEAEWTFVLLIFPDSDCVTFRAPLMKALLGTDAGDLVAS